MNVCVIQTLLAIPMKFVDPSDETHAKILSAELELNAIKSMVVWIVFVQSVSLAIHLLSVETLMNAWIMHAALMRYASIPQEAMIVNVNVGSLEIHLPCVHQFKLMSDVIIQMTVYAVIL